MALDSWLDKAHLEFGESVQGDAQNGAEPAQ
jgi:hypothetical protein